MIDEIMKKYGEFSDSWISEILMLNDEIHLLITCANKLNNYEYGTIKLICMKVESFFINQKHFKIIYGVKDALIKLDKDNSIIMDFEPINYFDYLKEDPNSTFKIKCKQIDYKFIEICR